MMKKKRFSFEKKFNKVLRGDNFHNRKIDRAVNLSLKKKLVRKYDRLLVLANALYNAQISRRSTYKLGRDPVKHQTRKNMLEDVNKDLAKIKIAPIGLETFKKYIKFLKANNIIFKTYKKNIANEEGVFFDGWVDYWLVSHFKKKLINIFSFDLLNRINSLRSFKAKFKEGISKFHVRAKEKTLLKWIDKKNMKARWKWKYKTKVFKLREYLIFIGHNPDPPLEE